MNDIKLNNLRQNKTIYWLSILGFFAIFSTTISKNPVLPLFVNHLGGSEALLGLIAALSPLAGIVFSFPIGFLIDRLGQKKLLLVSAFFFVAAPLSYIFVFNPIYLIPLRFFHGIATAILGPVATTMIFNIYPKSKGEKLGFYSSSTLVGRTLAPLIGGFLITTFSYLSNSWNYRMVYFAAFLFSLPVAIVAISFKQTKEIEGYKNTVRFKFADLLAALKRFLLESRLFSTSLVQMSVYFTFGVLETYLPIYLYDHGFSGTRIGMIFFLQIVTLALTQPVFGKIADRIDKRLQIIFGMLILGGSIALITFVTNYFLLAILSIIFGLGMSFATIAINSYVGDIVKKEELGTSMGALSSIMDVGQSSGPFITGLIITYISFSFGFIFSLLVCLLAIAFFVFGNYLKKPAKA